MLSSDCFLNAFIEQFTCEYRKVIDFALLRYAIGLKNSRQFLIQSEVKPKLVSVAGRTHFLALCVDYVQLLRALIGSLDCLCPCCRSGMFDVSSFFAALSSWGLVPDCSTRKEEGDEVKEDRGLIFPNSGRQSSLHLTRHLTPMIVKLKATSVTELVTLPQIS